MQTTVFKIGGSLFDLPDLANRIEWLLQRYPAQRQVLIGGGGLVANAVREWYLRFGLTEAQAHEIALSTMTTTAQLLHSLLPDSQFITGLRDVDSGVFVLDSSGLVEHLPRNWTVTSDSIAADVAARCEGKLILAKSVDAPSGLSFKEWADAGIVDAYFPTIAERVRQVDWCNLRNIEL